MTASELADDTFVLLDPAVELFRVGTTTMLCQTELEVGMVVPSGEGIADFIRSLAERPVQVGALYEEYDDRTLVNGMLASLLAHGFAYVTTREPPSRERLSELRAAAARRRAKTLRASLELDLDKPDEAAVLERWPTSSPGDIPPALVLHAARLSDHVTLVEELARRRTSGQLRVHHVVVRVASAACDDRMREAIVRLGAAVEIDGVAWPAPEAAIPGLAELARDRIAVHVRMSPDASLLDPAVRARAAAWICREAVSGLCLHLEPPRLWGELAAGDGAGVTDDALLAALEAVRAFEDVIGDVTIAAMASDEVLLANAAQPAPPADRSNLERRLRLAYLRWRLAMLRSYEGPYIWPQVPEVEAAWVRPSDDLLPNHPELLALRPGSTIVDVCGGLGRIARRLSPAVGDAGLIVSVELRHLMMERARRFACAQGFTNLQFRAGLAQRLPLPDRSVDAAVNEWTGVIWDLGLGPAMVNEMIRVVRPGGRIAVTHRLVQLRLDELDKPWVQYKTIYRLVRAAFERPGVKILSERVWGQIVPSIGDQNPSDWLEIYLPRLVTSNATLFAAVHAQDREENQTVSDVYLTLIAEREPDDQDAAK